MKPINILGNKYGRLTVMSRAENNHRGRTRWVCLCDCGNEKVVNGGDLRTGHSKSCGCLGTEKISNLNKSHGMSGSSEWKTWLAMKRRCYDKNQQFYDLYGGRGITVCDRWKESFQNFYDDMGARPDGMSLERIDSNGHYEPSNCKWATAKEQARNTSRNHYVTINGVTKALSAWSEELNLNYYTIKSRIYKLNWTPVEALFGRGAV